MLMASRSLDIHTAFIDRKLGRRYMERVLIGDDLQIAIRSFRTVATLVEKFQLKVNLSILESTEEIKDVSVSPLSPLDRPLIMSCAAGPQYRSKR
jgi:hypothetical protein